MLSIAPIAGAGSDYYLKDLESTSSYYLEGNSRTFWGGGAKQALGLKDGEVSKADFDKLMAGYVTDQQRIGNPCKENGWNHNPGRDFTFSDPKSVSILLQGPLRPQILELKKQAVEKAMAYGEQHFAETRTKGKIVGNQKMVWAVVNEDTSRANDPNGHSHVVVFNVVQGEDGKFSAMHNPKFYDNQLLMGQIYRNEIAKDIKDMGFTIEPAGKYGQWEIKDISQDIRESFSKRRQAILEKINPDNDTAKAREAICLITRPSKQNIMRETLKESWAAELKAHDTSFEKLSVPKAKTPQKTPWSLTQHVKTTSNIIAETETHIGKHQFYRRILDRAHGHFTIDEVTHEVNQQIDKGTLTLTEDGEYIARSVDRRRKKQVFQEMGKGHLQSKPLLSEQQFQAITEGSTLKDDQLDAIRVFTRSSSRNVKIQGDPGTGKTFALESSIPAIRANGYKVIGLSTTSESTKELVKTDVFDKVMTFQKYLMVPEGDKKTVLVIDEASMIGRDDMLNVLRFTNSKKMARVLFQGDENQMSGVKAGMPFKDMENAGVRSAVMSEIIRQEDIRQREAVTQLSRGNLKPAFELLKPEIQEVSQESMTDYAVKAWRASGNTKTPIIIQTNRQKNEINAAIKSQQLEANPRANQLTLKTWQTVHVTDTEKQFAESYAEATHIRFNRDYKRLGINRGDIFKVDGIDQEKAELNLSQQGQKRAFRPAQYKMGNGAIELYKQEERTLHEGDRIRFTRGGQRQPVNNNEYANVKSIDNGKVTFDLDAKTKEGLTLTLKDNAIRHIDHAWASTAHAFQGKTVDKAVVVMPSRRSPLTTLESLLTAASRHRLSVSIITDDADRLMNNIQEKLNIKSLEANISWPDVDLQNEYSAQEEANKDQTSVRYELSEQRSSSNEQNDQDQQEEQELKFEREELEHESVQEIEYEEDYSMGM